MWQVRWPVTGLFYICPCLFVFVYMCLVTCPFLETVYSFSCWGNLLPRLLPSHIENFLRFNWELRSPDSYPVALKIFWCLTKNLGGLQIFKTTGTSYHMWWHPASNHFTTVTHDLPICYMWAPMAILVSIYSPHKQILFFGSHMLCSSRLIPCDWHTHSLWFLLCHTNVKLLQKHPIIPKWLYRTFQLPVVRGLMAEW